MRSVNVWRKVNRRCFPSSDRYEPLQYMASNLGPYGIPQETQEVILVDFATSSAIGKSPFAAAFHGLNCRRPSTPHALAKRGSRQSLRSVRQREIITSSSKML